MNPTTFFDRARTALLSVGGLMFTVFLLTVSANAREDFTRYVDPFIGTGGHGHTFPGAAVPFGFVQLSPDTRIDDWDGSSGYHYSDDIIYGFSHTHLSGTGIPDYCDILFAPYVSQEDFFVAKKDDDTKTGFASKFSHDHEHAEPGYYSVLLEDENILAEMTSTKRVGLHRYTFPEKTNNAKFTLDLDWRDEVIDSSLKVIDDYRVEGFRRSKSWAKDQVVYFSAEFSKPMRSARGQLKTAAAADRSPDDKGKDVKAVFRFEVEKGEQILLKVGISAVSIEGARKNLEAELDHWDFEKVRGDAKAAWNKELSKIEVKGGTKGQMTNFYTALYHTMIAPNIFQDVDGRYLGLDKKIHTAPADTNYTIFSLWDTFRAAHPLYTIIDRKRTVDFINTFIRQYKEGGKLPVWELAANETDTMIGYHAVSVIADAMAKGIEGFDYVKAYEAAKNSSELDIEGLESYRKRGYISMEDEQESVSRTLEYAYNDYCLAVMAKILSEKTSPAADKRKPDKNANGSGGPATGKYAADFKKHLMRSQYYKNLFDKETGFMRPKQNGNWISPFAPNDVTFHFTEGNSWQYSFFVPHDVNGLISLFGGKNKFARKLDALFNTDAKLIGRDQPDITGLIGQYAHGNEPSHHIAYLYDYAGEPWKTQYYARKILDEFYKPAPDGLIGNEDCGQMSAWYVLSALGFYQVNPSVPVYSVGTPLFREARINLENGKSFVIRRNLPAGIDSKKSASLYNVKSLKLNGTPHRKSYFLHRDLENGGTLEFEMSETPVKNWFTKPPVSDVPIVSPVVPNIQGERVFEKDTNVVISSPAENSIRYTLDGTTPDKNSNEYKGPFKIGRTTKVRAITVSPDGSASLPAESILSKMPNNWDVQLFSAYNRQYTGGGPKGLVDGIRGTTNFASGEWQGYQDQDFVAVIDLKKETLVRKLGGGFLQVARSWIWMPTRIVFEVSVDGKNFAPAAEIKTGFPEREMTHTIKDYAVDVAPVNARYVRVTAINLGTIPAWHPGAGFQAFIFVDEILVN